MNIDKTLVAVILMALVTYIPRSMPLVIFRKEIKSTYIKSFLKYVPSAVMGSLTFPDIFSSTGNLVTAVCGTLMALWLSYREKSLVVVIIGAIATVYITGLII